MALAGSGQTNSQSLPYSKAEDNLPIWGGKKIVEILNVTLTDNSTWYAVTSTVPCKQVFIKCDTVDKFMTLSNVAAGTTFITIPKNETLQIKMGAPAGILFYIKGETNGNKTQVMLID